MIPADETFLDQAEREEIIRLVTHVINLMGKDGRRNLLLSCKLKDRVISRVKLNEDPRNTAESMVRLAETSDKPSPKLCYLREFLHAVIREVGYEGTPVETDMIRILSNYDHKRETLKNETRYIRNNPSLRPEEQAIAQQLQAKSDLSLNSELPITPSPPPPYEIDISTIITCNLDQQRQIFRQGINSLRTGFFTFSVASTADDILTEYVVKSLTSELESLSNPAIKTRIYPPIPIYPDFDCSNVEHACRAIRERIGIYLEERSFRDIYAETPEQHLAIVLLLPNPLPDNFKRVAIRFSEILEADLADMFDRRCLILFWANYGSPPIDSLELCIKIPAFSRFEIDHVIQWIKTSFHDQLEKQKIPKDKIVFYRDNLIEKIRYHKGLLPGTYRELIRLLQSGGIH